MFMNNKMFILFEVIFTMKDSSQFYINVKIPTLCLQNEDDMIDYVLKHAEITKNECDNLAKLSFHQNGNEIMPYIKKCNGIYHFDDDYSSLSFLFDIYT